MSLDLLLFNAQDLYVFMDKHRGEDLSSMDEAHWQLLSTSFFPNKPLQKIFSLKKIIEEASPDIIMLVEVGGAQSLENFNKHFLAQAYMPFLEDSNSNRGIDVGFLCKKGLEGRSFQLLNHSASELKNGRRFARGLFELRVYKEKKLECCLLLTHLKSKLDLKKEDFEGRSQRGAEVEFIVEHFKELQTKHPEVPVLVCGDMNGIIYKKHTDEELKPFLKAGLLDVFEILNRPLEERQSYFYFNKQRTRVPMQLDYILLHPKFKGLVDPSSRILSMDIELVPHPPENLEQKRKLPSDHYPVFCRLKL